LKACAVRKSVLSSNMFQNGQHYGLLSTEAPDDDTPAVSAATGRCQGTLPRATLTLVLLPVIAVLATAGYFSIEKQHMVTGRVGKSALWYQTAHFTKLTNGTCEDLGLVPITDEGTCMQAGKELGMADPSVFSTSLPPGTDQRCLVYQGKASDRATLWMGLKDLQRHGFRQICIAPGAAALAVAVTMSVHTTELGSPAHMSWVGCFAGELNTTQMRALAYPVSTTVACLNRCHGGTYTFMSLGRGSTCRCIRRFPPESQSRLIPDSQCGNVCHGEEYMTPRRYCGGYRSFAVYRIKAIT